MVLTQATPIAKRFMDAIQSCGLAINESAALPSGLHARHGDWVMRVRFWREITRDRADSCANALCARLSHQSPVT